MFKFTINCGGSATGATETPHMRSTPMTDRLHAYLLATGVRETPVAARCRSETQSQMGAAAGMQIGPEQGAFLAMLIELTGARLAIEIGVFTGYSALWLAGALPEGGRLIACEKDAAVAAKAEGYWKEADLRDKIDLKVAPALETLQGLDGLHGAVDVVFIDADKGNYDPYYEESLKLVRPGGLIAIDNTLWKGEVAEDAPASKQGRMLKAFNEKLHGDERVSLSLVPIGDGLTLARKR